MSRTAVATGARGGAAPGKYSETRGDALASARASMQKKFRRPMYAASETIRERLRELQATHVDQVILLNQAGENTHKDICESLELFAKEVMPEFHAHQPEQDAWKKAVPAGEIELEDIDTEPFNITRGRKPTQVSTKQARDMVAGVVGRPDSESLSGG